MRTLRSLPPIQPPPEIVSSKAFHEGGCKRAEMRTELSMSHQLRFPTEILGGRSYGDALGQAFSQRGLIGQDTKHVVDVGGGLGDVAKCLVKAVRARSPDAKCTMVDICRPFEEAQVEATRMFGDSVRHVHLDAQNLLVLGERADLVVANECIADFDAINKVPFTPMERMDPWTRGEMKMLHPGSGELTSEAWRLIEKYELPRPSVLEEGESFVVPVGQINFIEDLGMVLKPGGAAVIIEHSAPLPRIKCLPGHTEVSMSTDYLKRVAKKNGLTVEDGPLAKLLNVDPKTRVVDPDWVNYVHANGMDPDEHTAEFKSRYVHVKGCIERGEIPETKYPIGGIGDEKDPQWHEKLRKALERGGNRGYIISCMDDPVGILQHRWDQLCKDPNSKIIDVFSTPREFERLRTEEKWAEKSVDNLRYNNPKTTTLGTFIDCFGYLILKKPKGNANG